MSSSILGGDFTVYYLAESRRKQIRWTGGALKSNTRTMVEVYDAVQDLFTVSTQMDDGIIFSGETPAEYTIGKIDAGEIDPWFIDLETMEHIIGDYQNFTGCALKTSGWKRDLPGDGTGNTGIVVVAITNNDIDATDIGDTLTHATGGDQGTLLDVVITGGATDYLFIRPDTNALADDWNSTSGQIDMDGSAHYATSQDAAGVTGEMIWGNVYTQGALDPDSHIYMYQDGTRVTANDKTDQDWWVNGHIDRNVPITDFTSANFPLIDDGYLTVFARQYTFAYSYAIIRMNTTTGGAVSAGLSSGADINNTTGHKRILTGTWTGTFTVGEEIFDVATEAKAGIITAAVADTSIDYYPINDPITPFVASDPIEGRDSGATATMTAAGPTDQGPAALGTSPTLTFANTQVDIDDTGGTEPYGITIDVNQNTLADLYEWLKYAARRGSVLDMDGLDGQEFIGIDYRINYATVTGTVSEGALVTGATSGATGIIVSHDTTYDVALLRNSRGTFQDGERIYETDGVNEFDATGLTVSSITPVAEMPYGTLAGGVFFGSVGVVLTDYKSSEENSFILKDANGVQRVRPTTMSMTISNIKQYDWASCFRLTGSGGSVNKTERSCVGGEAIGDATIVTDSIAVDTPGKSTGGRLILVDVDDNNKEYAIRYSSWATATFTLANVAFVAEGGTTTTHITDVGSFANAQVGDLILNKDRTNAISYITEVVDDDNCNIFPAISGQTTGDNIEINAVPVVITSSDKVYVPIILKFAASDGDIEASMVYSATIYGRTRVRNTSDAAIKIKPFTSDVTITSAGGATAAVRNADPVYGA